MCGICGIYSKTNTPISKRRIEKMRDTMSARGPDGLGIHMAPHIGFGHRRLSIIDLSESANQPMSNEDGTIWLVQNGEIYNFEALRVELIKKGQRPSNSCFCRKSNQKQGATLRTAAKVCSSNPVRIYI